MSGGAVAMETALAATRPRAETGEILKSPNHSAARDVSCASSQADTRALESLADRRRIDAGGGPDLARVQPGAVAQAEPCFPERIERLAVLEHGDPPGERLHEIEGDEPRHRDEKGGNAEHYGAGGAEGPHRDHAGRHEYRPAADGAAR